MALSGTHPLPFNARQTKKGRAVEPYLLKSETITELVHGIFECFCGNELGNIAGINFDFGACLGISARTRFTLGGLEAAKTSDLDGIAFLQGIDDGAENAIDHFLSLFLGRNQFCHFVDQVTFIHC
ncbi:hypothetical protein DESC_780342 [Desulfosarcina cetonica]|nr:hypothetical protein DESC_780342 [Desulfosarcina cetonica]